MPRDDTAFRRGKRDQIIGHGRERCGTGLSVAWVTAVNRLLIDIGRQRNCGGSDPFEKGRAATGKAERWQEP